MNTKIRQKMLEELRRIISSRKRWRQITTYHSRRSENVECYRGIAKLEDWLYAKGFRLRWSKKITSHVSFDDKEVVINQSYRPLTQLAQLSHECGHILITQKPLLRRFAKGYPLQYSRFKHNLVHKTAIIEEEVEAWRRGENLLRSMKIRYDKDIFELCKAKSLKTYFKWICRTRKQRKSASGLMT